MERLKLFVRKHFYTLLYFVIPCIGVLAFKWPIGNIFLLFFLELLLDYVITFIEILISGYNSAFIERFWGVCFYTLGYSMALLVILITAGNFFNGAEDNMNNTVSKVIIYTITGSALLNFILSFFIRKKYKRTHYKVIRNTSFKKMGILFITLLIALPLLRFSIHSPNINYSLGIGLLAAKATAEIFFSESAGKKKAADPAS